MNTKNVYDIKNIISKNRGNIAFIIGNGIHRYIDDKDKEKKHGSWKDLLNKLSNGLLPFENDGISFTEFYDILELKQWEKEGKDSMGKIHIFLNHSNSTMLKDFNKQNKSPQIINNYKGDKKINIRDLLPSHDMNEIINYHIIHDFNKRFSSNSRSYLKALGYENVDILSDFECLHLMQSMPSNKIINNKNKRYIKDEMISWTIHPIINKIINRIRFYRAPLLTTNYDNVFSDAIKAPFNIMPSLNGNEGYNFSRFYPWNCYYGEQIEYPTSGFGIWHINGMVKYYQSISLGLSDYVNSMSRARKMIHKNKNIQGDIFDGMLPRLWEGQNTWLDIIFKKNLFIFGLSLDVNEVFLRWLLIERAKFHHGNKKNCKGWYIYNEIIEGEIPNGKKLFLESVGLEIINIDNYKTIYEDIWN